ncbi:hypothetical protein EVAR_82981_1 [Eumeta japonica]|uniref:Uncharacterized protein n=1 Tax=Eumeta variegata TaxID=151549 RepID=A0A4C1VQT3_EUMVA|nr:hypothetical protein EVAR_82981_1 [Eumeta japonica]
MSACNTSVFRTNPTVVVQGRFVERRHRVHGATFALVAENPPIILALWRPETQTRNISSHFARSSAHTDVEWYSFVFYMETPCYQSQTPACNSGCRTACDFDLGRAPDSNLDRALAFYPATPDSIFIHREIVGQPNTEQLRTATFNRSHGLIGDGRRQLAPAAAAAGAGELIKLSYLIKIILRKVRARTKAITRCRPSRTNDDNLRIFGANSHFTAVQANMLAEMLRAEAASAMEHCALPNRRLCIQISDIHSSRGEKKKESRTTINTYH